MPTKTIFLDGEKFEVGQPYAEGHVCTAIEARQLNQVRAEGISNNMRKRVKDLKLDGKLDEARALFEAYDAEYVFSMPGTSKPIDPVEKEAFSLARDYVKSKLAERGLKLTDIHPDYAALPEAEGKEKSEARFEAAIERAAQDESILTLARQRVEQKKAAAQNSSVSLDI